jgi:hypothetical protein
MYFSNLWAEGEIEGQDKIGQVSRDTSSLQDITSLEIIEVHEGGIEVDDEIGQVSRDTSSLQDITSPEITKVHEGGIEVVYLNSTFMYFNNF